MDKPARVCDRAPNCPVPFTHPKYITTGIYSMRSSCIRSRRRKILFRKQITFAICKAHTGRVRNLAPLPIKWEVLTLITA